jgi:hypothetical protein
MIVRCEKEYSSGYENYGGRGIRVCPEWYVYSTFKIWALSNGYSDELSIDRIDVDGNYEPNNCKWSTRGEQADNTRKTKYYEIGGRTNTMSGWCAEYNANRELVKLRVRRGVPILDALTLPKQKPHGIGGKPS